MRGLTAFREAYFASDLAHEVQYESAEARRMRYSVFWAMYSNDTYRSLVHNWSTGMKHQAALGKYIRSLYSPANRLGNFYSAHLLGGALSATAASDGAVPIATENEQLRAAIAHLWKQSNFAQLKDIITLRGAVEGDVVLRVRDDPNKEVVQLERIDVSTVTDLTKDSLGNVKGYILEEDRPDPKGKTRTVTYKEVVTRDGDYVVYETFLNNRPYAWTEDQPATWSLPYTFVPVVHIQHNNVGLDWGWSELMPMRSLVQECDDLASMISDQIRKSVNPTWLLKGMRKPKSGVSMTAAGAQRDETGGANTRPEPGREELKLWWDVPTEAKAEPLLAELNLKDALQHLDSLLEELERDYPELRADLHATSGTSGRALRVARQSISAKVLQRRESYDAGIVKLQKMAVAIGGFQGYKGYEGFGLDSYERGDLDHSIASRPVFEADPLDELEVSAALWLGAKAAVDAGATLEGYLKSQGLDEEAIAELIGVQDENRD